MSRTTSRRTEPQQSADARLNEEWAHTTGPQPTRDFQMQPAIPAAFRRTGDQRSIPDGVRYQNPDGTTSLYPIHPGAVPVAAGKPVPTFEPAPEKRPRARDGRTPIAEAARESLTRRAAAWAQQAPAPDPVPAAAPEPAPEPLRVHETWLLEFLRDMARDAAEGALRETGRECRYEGPDGKWQRALARAARYARLGTILEAVSTDQAAAGVLAAQDWRGADAEGAA